MDNLHRVLTKDIDVHDEGYYACLEIDPRLFLNEIVGSIVKRLEHFGEKFEKTGQRPALDPYIVPGDSFLSSLLRRDGRATAVPRIPGVQPERPSLLFHDLENEIHTDKDVYKYIDTTRSDQPGALYATSGAGKTRAVLEYVSHNYGLYLVAKDHGDHESDLGSADLTRTLKGLRPQSVPGIARTTF